MSSPGTPKTQVEPQPHKADLADTVNEPAP